MAGKLSITGRYLQERTRRLDAEEALYYLNEQYMQQHQLLVALLDSGRRICDGHTIITVQVVAPRKQKKLWTTMGARIIDT